MVALVHAKAWRIGGVGGGLLNPGCMKSTRGGRGDSINDSSEDGGKMVPTQVSPYLFGLCGCTFRCREFIGWAVLGLGLIALAAAPERVREPRCSGANRAACLGRGVGIV